MATRETPEEQAQGISKEDIAVTPLAVPMLAGPGAITIVILLGSKTTGIAETVAVVTTICCVSGLTFLVLRAAALYSFAFSLITIKIMTRLMGLLLAAIAVQF